jgi:hypothetical protein
MLSRVCGSELDFQSELYEVWVTPADMAGRGGARRKREDGCQRVNGEGGEKGC